MRHYASLWDMKYCPQGIALYESLRKHSSEPFKLHVLALDDETYRTLKALQCSGLDVWKLKRFQGRKGDWLLRSGGPNLRTYELGCIVDDSRSHAEFCWTMASQFTQWMLGWLHPGSNELTYLDADVYFFSDPASVFAEIGDRSIAITPHRFPDNDQKERLSASGKYNVGFVYFKNTDAGQSCLSKWARQVRGRCSAEVGCGDQGFLDSWEREFGDEVCILGPGVNLGPWSLVSHELSTRNGHVYIGPDRLICYHMHEYIHGKRLTNYPLRQIDKDLIYAAYRESVQCQQERIEA